jgi:hypothetical protein
MSAGATGASASCALSRGAKSSRHGRIHRDMAVPPYSHVTDALAIRYLHERPAPAHPSTCADVLVGPAFARHEITPPRFHGPRRSREQPSRRPGLRSLSRTRLAPGLPHPADRRPRPRLFTARRRRENLQPGRLQGRPLPDRHLPFKPLPHLARRGNPLHPVRRGPEGQGGRRRRHQPEQHSRA